MKRNKAQKGARPSEQEEIQLSCPKVYRTPIQAKVRFPDLYGTKSLVVNAAIKVIVLKPSRCDGETSLKWVADCTATSPFRNSTTRLKHTQLPVVSIFHCFRYNHDHTAEYWFAVSAFTFYLLLLCFVLVPSIISVFENCLKNEKWSRRNRSAWKIYINKKCIFKEKTSYCGRSSPVTIPCSLELRSNNAGDGGANQSSNDGVFKQRSHPEVYPLDPSVNHFQLLASSSVEDLTRQLKVAHSRSPAGNIGRCPESSQTYMVECSCNSHPTELAVLRIAGVTMITSSLNTLNIWK